jgi:signal peptide peptidase SppA
MKMSNLFSVSRAVYCEPWLIEPQMHRVLCGILDAHIKGGIEERESRRRGVELLTARMGEDAEEYKKPEPYSLVDGVAVVPLYGVIGRRVSALEQSSGVSDVGAFANAVQAAANDQQARAIVLDIDSPGGTVGGVQAAADAVRAANAVKPVIAHSGDLMASAAYWIGAAAGAVYADETAVIGSIGVYAAVLDSSRAMEMQGLKSEVFASGPYKGAGMPGTSLTDEQRQNIQARVDALAGVFKADVRRGRPAVADDAMQGQTMLAGQALTAGLIDSVATLPRAIADARKWADMR